MKLGKENEQNGYGFYLNCSGQLRKRRWTLHEVCPEKVSLAWTAVLWLRGCVSRLLNLKLNCYGKKNALRLGVIHLWCGDALTDHREVKVQSLAKRQNCLQQNRKVGVGESLNLE